MRKKAFLVYCIVSLVLVSQIVAITTKASSTEIKVINPETGDNNFIFYSNMTSIGTRFNATIWTYDVSNLFAHQVFFTVDDSLLNITNAWLPKWDSQYILYGLPTVPLGPIFYDDDGDGVYESVKIGDTILGLTSAEGSGLLAIIELEIIHTPEVGELTTELNINNPDTILLDPDLVDITTVKTNGLYRIIGAPLPPIQPAHIYIEPERISDPTLTPCNNFNVEVKIANASNLYAFNFKLSYDSAIVNVEDATAGDIFPPEAYSIQIDNVAGLLTVSVQLAPPEPPRSGNGTLLQVVFHVESIGATPLELLDIQLQDEEEESLPYTYENGSFSNIFMARLAIDPEQLISPELLPSYVFSVDVTVDDVEGLYGYEFNLTYNTDMLTCIGVYVYPINNESRFITSIQMNDMEGWLWVNVALYEPAVPITTYVPIPIVKLTFIVENPGSSILDLSDSSLVDSTGQPIPHEATDGYVQTLIHDVAVINVNAEPNWVYQGWIVNINVTVKNVGNVTENFDVKVYYDNNLIDTAAVNNLAPGEEETLYFAWNTSEVDEGIYTIKAEATEVPYEFNLENNVYVDGSVEVRTLIRDIALVSLTAYPTAVYSGWPVNVTITVRNEGNLTETFNIILRYNDSVIDVIEVQDLAPNEERIILYEWNTTGLPECSNYTISAEAPPIQHEFDVEDNYLVDGFVKIKLYGDINGDGKVDIRDIAEVSLAFGSHPGHPRWNVEADLNRDGKVDIVDVAIVSSNFGRVC